MRFPIGESIQLGRAESGQDGEVSFGVLVVNLDHATNEELFFFRSTSLPIIRLSDGHSKTLIPSPLLSLRFIFVLGIQVNIVLNGGEFLHGP